MARVIRISSGWGFANSFSVEDFQQLADIADGLELMATSRERFDFLQDADLEMETASLHLQSLPDTESDWYYALEESYPIDVVVVHATDDEELLENMQLEIESPPLAFENLDREAENSKEALKAVKKTDAMVTIDLQHLAETRTSAEAQAVIDELESRILQFHISGRTDEARHELVVNADNRGTLVPLLEYIATHHEVDDVPWVIEGRYETVDDLEEELTFLEDFD